MGTLGTTNTVSFVTTKQDLIQKFESYDPEGKYSLTSGAFQVETKYLEDGTEEYRFHISLPTSNQLRSFADSGPYKKFADEIKNYVASYLGAGLSDDLEGEYVSASLFTEESITSLKGAADMIADLNTENNDQAYDMFDNFLRSQEAQSYYGSADSTKSDKEYYKAYKGLASFVGNLSKLENDKRAEVIKKISGSSGSYSFEYEIGTDECLTSTVAQSCVVEQDDGATSDAEDGTFGWQVGEEKIGQGTSLLRVDYDIDLPEGELNEDNHQIMNFNRRAKATFIGTQLVHLSVYFRLGKYDVVVYEYDGEATWKINDDYRVDDLKPNSSGEVVLGKGWDPLSQDQPKLGVVSGVENVFGSVPSAHTGGITVLEKADALDVLAKVFRIGAMQAEDASPELVGLFSMHADKLDKLAEGKISFHNLADQGDDDSYLSYHFSNAELQALYLRCSDQNIQGASTSEASADDASAEKQVNPEQVKVALRNFLKQYNQQQQQQLLADFSQKGLIDNHYNPVKGKENDLLNYMMQIADAAAQQETP